MPSKPLKKLKHYPSWNEKIRAKATGRVFSLESNEKKRQSRLGKKHPAEVKEKIRQTLLRRGRMTPEEKEAEKAHKEKLRVTIVCNRRVKQWKLDQLTALRLGDMAMFAELKQSWGYKFRRTILDYPDISNGQTLGDTNPKAVIDYGLSRRRR